MKPILSTSILYLLYWTRSISTSIIALKCFGCHMVSTRRGLQSHSQWSHQRWILFTFGKLDFYLRKPLQILAFITYIFRMFDIRSPGLGWMKYANNWSIIFVFWLHIMTPRLLPRCDGDGSSPISVIWLSNIGQPVPVHQAQTLLTSDAIRFCFQPREKYSSGIYTFHPF